MFRLRRLIWAGLALPAFMLIAMVTGGTLWATSQSAFCGKCHEMRPEFLTWQASDHSRVPCVACHIKPGLGSFLKHKVLALNQVYRHFTVSYPLPISWPEPDSSTCLRCHEPAVGRAGVRGVQLAHQAHFGAGVGCVECHRGVAHGAIAERGQTADGEFQHWDAAFAGQQMVRTNKVAGEAQCLDCHSREAMQPGCQTCHTGPVLPKNHQAPGWRTRSHGVTAREHLETCKNCHAATESHLTVPASSPVASYARGNTLCMVCHARRPPSHGPDYRKTHGSTARAGTSGCLVCHNQTRPMAKDRAAPTYCRQCHSGGE